jgi:hypothetical protein
MDDDQLLEVLRDALNATQVPRGFVEAGKAAYAWRTIDAELAALTYDSQWDTGADSGQLALTRATESATLRALTFASGDLTIELELTPDGLLGQLDPPGAGTVGVHAEAGELASVPVDDLGFFVVRPVPAGTFRLLCRTDSGATVLTGWVSP